MISESIFRLHKPFKYSTKLEISDFSKLKNKYTYFHYYSKKYFQILLFNNNNNNKYTYGNNLQLTKLIQSNVIFYYAFLGGGYCILPAINYVA